MICRLTGKENKTLKLIKSLKKRSNRHENGLFIAEGVRIVEEAIEFAPGDLYCVVVTDSFNEKNSARIEEITLLCDKVYIVSEAIFNDISDTDTPQGIMAVIKMPCKDWDASRGKDSSASRAVVVLDGVSEPGNMGTIIRTAEALGFDGVYLMKGCTDIYGPKTVRATMGSVFRMNFKDGCTASDIQNLKDSGFKIISTTPLGDTEMEDYCPSGDQAVIIGNEAHGVSSELMELSDLKMRIRMDGLAESLNAAIAAGIVMHWLKNYREKA